MELIFSTLLGIVYFYLIFSIPTIGFTSKLIISILLSFITFLGAIWFESINDKIKSGELKDFPNINYYILYFLCGPVAWIIVFIAYCMVLSKRAEQFLFFLLDIKKDTNKGNVVERENK